MIPVATSLDQKIEELEKIVEHRLDLCKAIRNGVRCTLPADHKPAAPHKFQLNPEMPFKKATQK